MPKPVNCVCGARLTDCEKHRPQRGPAIGEPRHGRPGKLGEWTESAIQADLAAHAEVCGADLNPRAATDEEALDDPNLGVSFDGDGDHTANHYYYGVSNDGIPESNRGVPMDRARWAICSINGRWPNQDGYAAGLTFLCWLWNERRAAISRVVDAAGVGKRGIRLDASNEGDEWVLRNYDNKAEIGRI